MTKKLLKTAKCLRNFIFKSSTTPSMDEYFSMLNSMEKLNLLSRREVIRS